MLNDALTHSAVLIQVKKPIDDLKILQCSRASSFDVSSSCVYTYRVMACMAMGKRFISHSLLMKRTSKEVYHFFHESILTFLFIQLVF